MRLFQHIITLTFAALTFAACQNGDNNDLPKNPVKSECYKGTMKVNQNDGTFYTQDDVEVDFEIKDGKLNFAMYKVKFANGMPIKLDMVVEGATIDYSDNDGNYSISGDGLVPYAMGGPFEKFTITGLEGEITPTTFTLDFICGEYPVTYTGTK